MVANRCDCLKVVIEAPQYLAYVQKAHISRIFLPSQNLQTSLSNSTYILALQVLYLEMMLSCLQRVEKFLSRNSVLKRLFSRKLYLKYTPQNRSKCAVSAGILHYQNQLLQMCICRDYIHSIGENMYA